MRAKEINKPRSCRSAPALWDGGVTRSGQKPGAPSVAPQRMELPRSSVSFASVPPAKCRFPPPVASGASEEWRKTDRAAPFCLRAGVRVRTTGSRIPMLGKDAALRRKAGP